MLAHVINLDLPDVSKEIHEDGLGGSPPIIQDAVAWPLGPRRTAVHAQLMGHPQHHNVWGYVKTFDIMQAESKKIPPLEPCYLQQDGRGTRPIDDAGCPAAGALPTVDRPWRELTVSG